MVRAPTGASWRCNLSLIQIAGSNFRGCSYMFTFECYGRDVVLVCMTLGMWLPFLNWKMDLSFRDGYGGM